MWWPGLLLSRVVRKDRPGPGSRAVPGPAGAGCARGSQVGMQVCLGEPSGPRALLQCRRLPRHPLGNRPGAACTGRQPGHAGPGRGGGAPVGTPPSQLCGKGGCICARAPQRGRVPSGAGGICRAVHATGANHPGGTAQTLGGATCAQHEPQLRDGPEGIVLMSTGSCRWLAPGSHGASRRLVAQWGVQLRSRMG